MQISSINNATSTFVSNKKKSNGLDVVNNDKKISSSLDTQKINNDLPREITPSSLINDVANGTADRFQMADFTNKLKEFAIKDQPFFSKGTIVLKIGPETEMHKLMDKVVNGTATAGDTQKIAIKMKEHLSDMQTHFGGMPFTNTVIYL